MRPPPIPSEIERAVLTECISAEAAQQYLTGALPHSVLQEFVPTLKAISSSYVQARGMPQIFDDALRARAYGLYYLPINFAKIQSVILRAAALKTGRHLRICDYGSGPGTAALAFASLSATPCSITCFDQSDAMRKLGTAIFRSVFQKSPDTHATFVPTDPLNTSSRYDYIFAANVLNEMSEAEATTLTLQMSSSLESDGTLIVLEPALLEPTRKLMRIRDALLRNCPDLSPLFPCTHSQPCPMLRDSPDDWCHGTITWDRPNIVQALDNLTGFNKHRTKFSALVLRRGVGVKGGLRVITDSTKSNRGNSAIVCGERFFGSLELLKRHRSDTNREFLRAEGFDHLSISGWDGEGNIQEHSVVSREAD